MDIRYYIIDAFSEQAFGGNPAGVCVLDKWIEDGILQAIAAENNLSETAFLVEAGSHYDLRWFTPKVEIDLCGHGTLASAYAIFEFINTKSQCVEFETKSGKLFCVDMGERVAIGGRAVTYLSGTIRIY